MSEFLDRAGLAYYDGKLKTYVTTEMNEALEEALAEFSSALIFQDFITVNTTMHDTYATAKKGYVYIVNAANVSITYYNSQGTLVSEPVEIGDTIICLKEKEGTTAATQSRWGILQVNWDVQNTGNVLQFGSAITIAVVGGKNITVELPELRLAVGTSYVEIPSGSGYVEIPSVMFDSTNGFTVTIGSTTVSIASIAALQQALGITAVVADVNYDTTNKKFTKTKNGTTTDIVTATQLKTDMQLNNVGNFKAVSTVANQGLTATEKSNARTNIGLDTAIRIVGTIDDTINLNTAQNALYEALKVDDLPSAIQVTYTRENGDTETVSPEVGDIFVCVRPYDSTGGSYANWTWITEGRDTAIPNSWIDTLFPDDSEA